MFANKMMNSLAKNKHTLFSIYTFLWKCWFTGLPLAGWIGSGSGGSCGSTSFGLACSWWYGHLVGSLGLLGPVHVLEHGDARKLWATPKLGQVVANGIQVVQTLGLGSCHLVQASLQIWGPTLSGCHLVQVSHGLENFCLTLLETNHMVCVQAGSH